MNNARRKRIAEITKQLEQFKESIDALMTLKEDIDELTTEEQEAFDNLPEGLQQAEKGQDMEQAVSTLEDASSSLEDAITAANEAFDEVITALGAASGI